MKKFKIQKNDYDRSLITETIPYETPIIFSNSGFYNLLSSKGLKNIIQSKIIDKIISDKDIKSIPYHYKIKKDDIEYRRLALLHPSSQLSIRDMYEQYEMLMLHYCNRSPASIRSIKNVASSFYIKSSWENINKFKENSVSLNKEDKYTKYSPSFFSYRGFDRLYKFFNSKLYFNLEKKYSHLRTLDISKCFDSIYTHTLLWATKDKEYAKSNLTGSNFADTFDKVIRQGNYNETNGIPIGAEISRIFAEIILQKIDLNVISSLEKENLKFDINYSFKRYVDDIYIFTNDQKTSEKIYKTFSNELLNYNLHVNASKTTTTTRPFTTKKSKIIFSLNNRANDFFDKFLEINEKGSLSPKGIVSPWKLSKNFIEAIKDTCGNQEASYSDVAPYLISIFNERVKKIVACDEISDANEQSRYHTCITVFLEIIFFLYTVAPSVGASYRLCTSLILIHRFSKANLKKYYDSICAQIYSLTLELLSAQSLNKKEIKSQTFLNLEAINIILSIKELGINYLIPKNIFKDILSATENFSYFTIVSCLFYFDNKDIYKDIKDEIIDNCITQLKDIKHSFNKSELVHLFMDLIYCPYLDNSKKELLINNFFKDPPKKSDVAYFLNNANKDYAFVNWKEIDLLNSLEKKELKQAY